MQGWRRRQPVETTKHNGGNQFANGALERSEIYSGAQVRDARGFRGITSQVGASRCLTPEAEYGGITPRAMRPARALVVQSRSARSSTCSGRRGQPARRTTADPYAMSSCPILVPGSPPHVRRQLAGGNERPRIMPHKNEDSLVLSCPSRQSSNVIDWACRWKSGENLL